MKYQKPYINPYIAGILLGLVLLATYVLTGRGLGASGAVKSGVIYAVEKTAPAYAASSNFYQSGAKSHEGGPLKNWLVIELIGAFIGAFFSGIYSGRMKFTIDKGPNASNKARLIGATLGGLLFGLGAQFGRGCTSGAALSGMAVMSYGGIITMLAIFGSAYLFAYFFRKLWI